MEGRGYKSIDGRISDADPDIDWVPSAELVCWTLFMLHSLTAVFFLFILNTTWVSCRGGHSSPSSLPVTCCPGGFVAVCLLSLLSRLFALTQYHRHVEPLPMRLTSTVMWYGGWSLVYFQRGRMKDLKVRHLLRDARNDAGDIHTFQLSSAYPHILPFSLSS